MSKRPLFISSGNAKAPCIRSASLAKSVNQISFAPVSTSTNFQPLIEMFSSSKSFLGIVSGPCGSGKTHSITDLVQKAKFILNVFDPSESRNIETELDLIASVTNKFSANQRSRRLILIDDIDGFSDVQFKQVHQYLTKKYNPMKCCSIVITLTEWTSKLLQLNKLVPDCNQVRIIKPTVEQLQNFARKQKKYSKENIIEASNSVNGDIRQFMLTLDLFSLSADKTVHLIDKAQCHHSALKDILSHTLGYDSLQFVNYRYSFTDDLITSMLNNSKDIHAVADAISSIHEFERTPTHNTFDVQKNLKENLLCESLKQHSIQPHSNVKYHKHCRKTIFRDY